MIHTDFYKTREDGVKLYRACSDEFIIQKNGTDEMFTEAIDVENSGNTYTETDIPLEEEKELTVEDTFPMFNSLGVDTDDN